MTEEQLNQLSIFALRELARRMGVVSPTSKKKEELIDSILKIENGTLQPCLNKTKQGRPPKSLGYDFNNFQQNIESEKNFVLKQNERSSFNYQDVKTASGYLELVGAGSAYFWLKDDLSKGCYFVDSNIVSKYNLRSGDKIVAELDVENNQRVVKEILNVNDTAMSNFDLTRQNYFEIAHKLPTKVISCEDKNYKKLGLKYGENVFVYGSSNVANTLSLLKLQNSLKDTKKIYLNVAMSERNKMLLTELNDIELFVCDLMDTKEVALRISKLALERAKRLLEQNENVVLIVDDLQTIMSFDDDNLFVTKSITTLAKNAEQKGSITLLAISQNMQTAWLEKMCDRRLVVEEENINLKI